jgi:uncharacterized protein YbaP (TraB family)
MMNKILRRLTAPFAALLSLGSAAEARAPQTARPALWEVSDPDTTIYLFGTIHLLPDDYQWRTPAFDQAVLSSQKLVVETIVDQQNLQSIRDAEMQLGFGKKLPPVAQRVPPSKLPLLRAAIAKSGLQEKVLDQMDTWLAAISLLGVQFAELGLKGAHGPEEVLRQQFLAAHKPIGELESNVEQFGFFDRLPESAQRALLEGAIEPTGMAKHEFDQMLGPWSRGDVKGIGATFNAEFAGSPALKQALLVQRNANWAKWIQQRMAEPGTIMVAVGAGHLAGNSSVLQLLKKDGYKIRRLQ